MTGFLLWRGEFSTQQFILRYYVTQRGSGEAKRLLAGGWINDKQRV